MGSGRCGTASLADLLDSQIDASVTHEFCYLPWGFKQSLWNRVASKLFSRKPPYDTEVIGDVGYYWINYIDRALDIEPDAKFICLWRNRKEVMDSMWRHSRGLNVYSQDNKENPYPYYDTDRYTAIGRMWDDYAALSEKWSDKYPSNFMCIEMGKALNDTHGQREMLRFAGFKNPIIRLGIKLNVSKEN